MQRKWRISRLYIVLCSSAVFVWIGCTDTTSSPAVSGSGVAFWSVIDNSGAHSSPSKVQPITFSTVDSIQITSAGFGASGFELRSDLADAIPTSDLSIVQIRTEQFLLAFDQSSRQNIGGQLASPGVYQSARFDLHPLAGKNDSLQAALGPLFESLFGTYGNKTIVIKGFIIGEESAPFTYTTTISGSERIPFDAPLTVSGNGEQINMFVKLRTRDAFLSNGMLMDPRDGNNAAAIDANLRMALRASVGQ